MSQPIPRIVGSSTLNRMMFETTYGGIRAECIAAGHDIFQKNGHGEYTVFGTQAAWELWQQARLCPEYINRPTVVLVQDLLKYVESHDVYGFERELKERGRQFIQANADKVNNVIVGPWTDGKKE